MLITGSSYATTGYATLAASLSTSATTTSSTAATPTATEAAATTITLSDAAKAALALKDFATVSSDARTKLDAILKAAGRTTPLQDGKLAIDLSTLDQRELYAVSSNGNGTASFSKDEQSAAALEMQRRFDSALSGPAAVAKVTGNYTGLYSAAASYLDGLSAEEKAEPEVQAARAAVTAAQKKLVADPKTLPDVGSDDPVALYLSLSDAQQQNSTRAITDVAADMRKALDAAYAAIKARGQIPTFDKTRKGAELVDLSNFSSRQVAAIALNTDSKFSDDETRAAKSAINQRSSTALLAGFKAAGSTDPTAFSQNIISMYGSMSAEERQASGISDTLYQAAVASYQSASKLMNMFSQATGGTTGFESLLGSGSGASSSLFG